MKSASPSVDRPPAATSRGARPMAPAATAKPSSGQHRSRAAAAHAISDTSSDLSDLGGSLADRLADKDTAAKDSAPGALGALGASRGGGASPSVASPTAASPKAASPKVASPKATSPKVDVSRDDSLSSLSSSANRQPVAKAAVDGNKAKVTRAGVQDFEEEAAPRKKEAAPPRIAAVAPPTAPRARPIAATAEPPASPSAPASAAVSAPAAESRRPIAELAPTPETKERAETSRSDGSASPEAPLVRAARAEKFMASGAWNQAIAIYKALLKDFPRDAAASTWRRRLADAETAAKRSGSSFAQPPAPSAK